MSKMGGVGGGRRGRGRGVGVGAGAGICPEPEMPKLGGFGNPGWIAKKYTKLKIIFEISS